MNRRPKLTHLSDSFILFLTNCRVGEYKEMLTVETIRKIRLAKHRDGKAIRQIAREFNHSKNTVKKGLRSEETVFRYERNSQPRPKLGPFVESLEARLEEDQKLPKKRRRTAMVLFEELQAEGYSGAYDSVRRHVRKWRREKRALGTQVFIPLSFDPAEAFQFDWSHEKVELAGMPATVKVAHLRLCHSRLFLVTAYPRETQEMVFDAHIRAFEFFGGVCQRGIYDNMKAVVNKVLSGKERVFNSRFEQLCSHYLYEPVPCTPAAGWEKRQVENQTGLVRKRFFTPRPKFAGYDELNAWLMSKCISWAKTHNRKLHIRSSYMEFPIRLLGLHIISLNSPSARILFATICRGPCNLFLGEENWSTLQF